MTTSQTFSKVCTQAFVTNNKWFAFLTTGSPFWTTGTFGYGTQPNLMQASIPAWQQTSLVWQTAKEASQLKVFHVPSLHFITASFATRFCSGQKFWTLFSNAGFLRCWKHSAHCLSASNTVREYAQWKRPRVVRSSGLGIAFQLWCCDLLYFIKNECELGINCCALSGFILCTLLFFLSCFHRGIVFSPPSCCICWHIQRTIPSLWPPIPPPFFSQRLHGSFVPLLFILPWSFLLAGLQRFMELLISSISLKEKKFMPHISHGLV